MKATIAFGLLVLALIVWESEAIYCDCQDGCNDGCMRCKKTDGKLYHKCKECNSGDKPGFTGACKQSSSCTKCVFCRKTNPQPTDKRFVACNTCPSGSSLAHGEFDGGSCPSKPPGF